MSWLANLARTFSQAGTGMVAAGTQAYDTLSDTLRGVDTRAAAGVDTGADGAGIDWSKVPGTLPSTPDSRHASRVPLLDPEQYIKGEWEGPFSAGGRAQLSVGEMPDLIDPTLPQHHKDVGPAQAVGAAQQAGHEQKRHLTFEPGPKDLRGHLDQLQAQYAATGRAGAAGRPAPPPFRYDWDRPAQPQFQRAEPFQFDHTDPLGAEVREARPRPAEFERDRQRYEKLLGS